MLNELASLDPKPSAQAQRFTRLCAGGAFGIALVAEAGWLFDARSLAGQWGGYLPMAPSTALAFLLLCSGVWSHARGSADRLSRGFVMAAGVLTILLGVLALARVYAGLDTGVEWALSRTNEAVGGHPLGRMAPSTAATLIFEAVALLLLLQVARWRFAGSMAALLALLGTAAGLMFLVGYVYRAPLLYGGTTIAAALPTALAIVLAGVGVGRLALPEAPALRAWRGNSTRGILLRAFLPGMLMFVLLDGWLDSMGRIATAMNPALWHSLEALAVCVMIIALTIWTARRTGDAIERAQEALEKSRSLHAESERMGKVGGWEFDPDTQEQVWTEEVYRIHEVDFTYQPTVSKGIGFYTPESRPIIERAVQRAIQQNEPFDLELQIITAKGNLRWVHAIGKMDAKRRRVFGYFQDVTERKRGEAAARASEEKFVSVFRFSPAAISLSDVESGFRFVDVNEAFEQTTGYARDEIAGRTAADLGIWVDPDEFTEVLKRLRENGGVRDFEFRFRRKDGVTRTGLISVEPIELNGRACVLTAHLDITERRRNENALRKSSRQFRTVAKCVPDTIWTMDLSGRLTFVSPNVRRTHGWTVEEALKLNFRDTITPEQAIRSERQLEEELKRAASPEYDRNQVFTFESEELRKDGTTFWAQVNASFIWSDDGRPIGLIGVTRDISERKRAEEALRESADRLALILEATSDGFWDWNIASGDAVFSPRYSTMLGYDPEDFAKNYKSWKGLVHPDDVESVKQHHADHFAGRTAFSIEFRMREKSGKWHWIHSRGLVVERDADGRPLRMVGTHSDIQERKEAEEERNSLQLQLAQAQRMESVGRLAGGIAHDFGNLMGVILLHGDSALEELKSGDPLTEPLTEIRKTALRATSLTQQLLAFSRKQVLQTKVLDLNSVIANSETMLRRLMGENIFLESIPGAGLGLVRADPGQIEQIIMNLAVNSRDAMPEGGKLTIETANVELDASYVRLNPGAREGSYVMLAVRDTGFGMDPEAQNRIFDPFFTTKEVGKGTGLGLSIVYGIVKQSDGFVTVHSEPGRGAEFRIYLPRVLASEEAVPAVEVAPAQRGFETILVAEDDPTLRETVCRLLERAGYEVLAGKDVDECIQIATRHKGPLDLLLTDVVMPDMSGPQLARHLQPLLPRMRVLFMSGYSEPRHADFALVSEVEFIQKPFTKHALLRRLREVLEGEL